MNKISTPSLHENYHFATVNYDKNLFWIHREQKDMFFVTVKNDIKLKISLLRICKQVSNL